MTYTLNNIGIFVAVVGNLKLFVKEKKDLYGSVVWDKRNSLPLGIETFKNEKS